jgi:large subunit ribosomal protein L3
MSLFAKSLFASKSPLGLTPARSLVASLHSSAFNAQAAPATWRPQSVRTGVIAKKKGMTSVWSESGVRMPVTVLQVRDLYCIMRGGTYTIFLVGKCHCHRCSLR